MKMIIIPNRFTFEKGRPLFPSTYRHNNSISTTYSMKLCRICLRSKSKMYNLQNEPFRTYLEAIAPSMVDEINLPTTVCYLCSRHLQKCHSLIKRTQMAKATLQNICSRYGGASFDALKITKDSTIMKEINKAKSSLSTKLKTIKLSKISLNGDVKDKMDDLFNGSYKITYSSNIDIDQKRSKDSIEQVYTRDLDIYPIKEDLSDHIETDNDNEYYVDNDYQVDQPSAMDEDVGDEDVDDVPLSAIKLEHHFGDPIMQEREEQRKPKKIKQGVQGRKRRKAVVNSEGLTQEDIELKQYFDIIVMSVEEQIAERMRMKETTTYRDALYRCEICYRTYLHPRAHTTHLLAHHASQGEWECRVCKLRFRSESTMLSHSDKSHGKKYCCKTCPKTYTKLELAAKHSKRHTGYLYKCSMCEHRAVNKSALKNHLRTSHSVGGSRCSLCGHTFTNIRGLKLHTMRLHHVKLEIDEQRESFYCRKCKLRFPTEDALATHNEMQHLVETAICSTCGEEFSSHSELNKHSKLVHGDETNWGLGGDTYPTKCEYCGTQVNNRKEHYFHVRKSHPKERENYQAVITAVCDTCGKGFQNATKLHLHELRHKGEASVRCPHCPRLFYDKFQLARHIGVHSDERPFACTHCDKTFKLRSNLDRHAKVHSDVTAYECSLCNKRFRYSSSRNLHIKTVHYKMPQPPRKRKTAKSNKTLNYDECMQ